MANFRGSSPEATVRVLQVDDDAPILEVSKRILMMENNFEIDGATSVDEAIKKMATKNYDVIVSDYEMPLKSGLDFLKELREQKNEIPFILFTGRGREEVAITALNLGANGYHNKQGSPETIFGELAHTVKAVVAHNKAETALVESQILTHSIIDSTNDLIWSVNSDDFGLMDFNESLRAYFLNEMGISIEKGMCPEKMFPTAQLVEKWIKFYKRVLKGGSFSTEYKSHRGKYFFQLSFSVIKKEHKRFGISVFGKNITEQRLLNESLQINQDRLQKAQAIAHVGNWELDLQTKEIWGSEEAFKIYGLKRTNDCLPYALVKESVLPEYRPNLDLALKELIMNNREYNVEYKIKRANDGEERFIHSKAELVFAPNKIPIKINGVIQDITESKEAEERLLESEERYRTLFDQAGDYILVLEIPPGQIPTIYDANDFALRVHGYSKEEILGKPITFLDVSSSKDTILERAKQLLKKEKITFEAVHQRKDGSQFTAEIVNKHVKVGEKDFLLAIERDITERKKVEEELKIYYNFLSLATDSILVSDLKGNLVYFNEAAYKKLGYSKEEISKMKLRALETPESAQFLESRFKDLLEKGSAVFEVEQMGKDKIRIPMEVHARIIESNGKKMFLGVLRDISERKKAEEKLSQSDRIFQYSIDMICMAGFDGYFKVLNPAWSKTLGWSKEELLSKPWIEFVHSEDKTATSNIRAKLIDGREVYQFQNRYICKDGSTKWLSWNSFPYPTEKIIFGVARDITEQKETEDKLAAVNEKLRVVGKLTRHDIRNKLSIISSNTYLLKKKLGNSPEIAEYLTDINSAVTMSNRFFEFSQLYEKIGIEEQTEIDVKSCFDEATALFLNLDKIQVVNKLMGLTVVADSLLRQIFYNLIDNSIKHGKIVTQIRTRYLTKDGQTKLFFEDNGVGVPKENKEKVFDEGFTTDEGTGLGLPMIRKILEVYGWKIIEEGIPGKGAKFKIIIPKQSIISKSNNVKKF